MSYKRKATKERVAANGCEGERAAEEPGTYSLGLVHGEIPTESALRQPVVQNPHGRHACPEEEARNAHQVRLRNERFK